MGANLTAGPGRLGRCDLRGPRTGRLRVAREDVRGLPLRAVRSASDSLPVALRSLRACDISDKKQYQKLLRQFGLRGRALPAAPAADRLGPGPQIESSKESHANVATATGMTRPHTQKKGVSWAPFFGRCLGSGSFVPPGSPVCSERQRRTRRYETLAQTVSAGHRHWPCARCIPAGSAPCGPSPAVSASSG